MVVESVPYVSDNVYCISRLILDRLFYNALRGNP
ncbi:hypothetical protein BN874_2070001 [Candidatus Contendobacter odensis Run_B_J11]|uniref:Uncharacterized protein n=1 Tax=Candidatus Contendobacter odensis Run_B_J11 TaxID=1400861 RepID=A0A7U7GAY4_9GAMM|nr:hypothetical protein BN874_2070001 [Candidatus Contendobacter odensis Run_B_J11]